MTPDIDEVLTDINTARHQPGMNAWWSDVLKRAHRVIVDLRKVSVTPEEINLPTNKDKDLGAKMASEEINLKTEVTFTYKNYRGEISVRVVRPVMLSFGRTGYHPEPQWLLHAWDLYKEAERTFAVKDIKDWDPAP